MDDRDQLNLIGVIVVVGNVGVEVGVSSREGMCGS